jgi:DNA-binding CsgD family transcriptional regulator
MIQPPANLIEQLQTYFINQYPPPANEHFTDDVKNLLEHPLLKQFIFSNNQIAIIDHSIAGYRYVSDSIVDDLGLSKEDFLEKGFAYTFGFMHPEDLPTLLPIFEKITAIWQQVEAQKRSYVRFNFTFRGKLHDGYHLIYQQNIPLAYNEAGRPYLVIALLSDITSYAKFDGVQYQLTLNEPGMPTVELLSSKQAASNNPLSTRESDVLKHIAHGFTTQEIAERLFISEGTVRKHRENILQKTGAQNSVHLVRMAVANGWV